MRGIPDCDSILGAEVMKRLLLVGVSLLAPCTFRFRRKTREGWDRVSLTVEPRSAYLLSGPSRTVWEHSIPPLDRHRYSITFRTLAAARR